jgi:hypothetical protein
VVGIESLSVDGIAEAQASGADSPYDLPFGLINFKLIVDQPGDLAEITVYFSEPAPEEGRWLKYDSIETTWTDFSSQTIFNNDRTAVTLYLEDGGDGDADGIANGFIVDPSGVSVDSFGSSGSVGGGCFIGTASSGSVLCGKLISYALFNLVVACLGIFTFDRIMRRR